MRDFADVTEDQVKAVYDKSPDCNTVMTWEEVKGFKPMYLILKNQAHADLNPLVEQMPNSSRIFYGDKKPPVLRVVATQEPPAVNEAIKKAKVIVIGRSRADKIAHALCLARNCLQSGAVNDSLRNEALRELAEVQQFLKPPQHGKK